MGIQRPIFLIVLVLAAATNATPDVRPNLIHILVDDWGYNDVGFRDPYLATPVMDNLAKEGVILENFYMTPVCTPSRAALATGRMPWRLGLQDFKPDVDTPLGVPLSEEFLSQRLFNDGYRTAIVGKWDLGVSSKEQLPIYRGFGDPDFQLPGQPSQTWGGGLNQVNFAITNKQLVDTEGFKGYFKSSYGLLEQNRSLDYLWDIHDGTICNPVGTVAEQEGCKVQHQALNISGGLTGTLTTDVYAEASVKYIQKHATLNQGGATQKPLFLYLAFTAVHSAVQALKSDIVGTRCKDYPADHKRFTTHMEEEAATKCAATYPWKNTFENVFPGPPCNDGIHKRRTQCGAVHSIDRAIGRVVDALKAADMWNNTVMLIHGDNGGELADGSSNYPFYNSKGSGFEGGMRTPAFYTGGKVVADKKAVGSSHNTSYGMYTVVDVHATWAALANLSAPAAPLDGVNQYPYVVNPTVVAEPRVEGVMVYGTPLLGSMQVGLIKMPENGHTYKLVRNPTGWTLYGVAVLMQSCAVETASCLCWLGCIVDFLKAGQEDQGDPSGEDDSAIDKFLKLKSMSQSMDSGPKSGISDQSIIEKLENLKEGPFCTGVEQIRITARKAQVDGTAAAMRAAVNASQTTLTVLANKVAENNGDQWFLFDVTENPNEGDGSCLNTTDCPDTVNLYKKASDASDNTTVEARALKALMKLFDQAEQDSIPSGYSPFSDPWADFVALGEFINPFRHQNGDAVLWDPNNPPKATEYPESCELKEALDSVKAIIITIIVVAVVVVLCCVVLCCLCCKGIITCSRGVFGCCCQWSGKGSFKRTEAIPLD